MRATNAFPFILALAAAQAFAQIPFKKVALTPITMGTTETPLFVGEGVTVGDFNKDGNLDVAAGIDIWLGPDFTKKQKYGAGAETFNGATGYASYYMNLPAMDVNKDGWMDIPVSAGVGGKDFWLENPKGGTGTWVEHPIAAYAGFETNCLYPLLKNGSLQLLYATNDKKVGYATPDPADPTKAWTFHQVGDPSPPGGSYNGYILNSHGLGMGDINGDGRNDVMVSDAWFEQPASLVGDPLWIRHNFDFNQKKAHPEITATNQAWGGSHMYTSDVDGDGDSDVVAALDGHGWGLAWFEQVKATDGSITFKDHIIMGARTQEATYGVAFSELHSLQFIDLNGDGLKDIVTGKRWWAHNKGGADAENEGAAVLYAFLQKRGAGPGTTTFTPVLLDSAVGSGCRLEVVDMNTDGYPDVVVAGKKGVYVYLSTNRTPIAILGPSWAQARRSGWRLSIMADRTPGLAVSGGVSKALNLLGASLPILEASHGGVLIRKD